MTGDGTVGITTSDDDVKLTVDAGGLTIGAAGDAGVNDITLGAGDQLDLRTEASKLMLRTSHMQVQEIAVEVGFTDIYQFSKAFKLRTGMSPVAFRHSPSGCQATLVTPD